jgi:hypothetical protein
MMLDEVLTTESPRWDEFANKLDSAIAALGCDGDESEGPNPDQPNPNHYRHAKQIMTAMGDIDIPASLAFFESRHGFCDCEILLNVDPTGRIFARMFEPERAACPLNRTTRGEMGMDNNEIIELENEVMTVEQYLAIRKEAALQIDAETAEFSWGWGQIMDPYGIYPDPPEEYDCIVGRVYFARSSGSNVWVSFYDLPEATVERLWERIRKEELRERDWLDTLFKDGV